MRVEVNRDVTAKFIKDITKAKLNAKLIDTTTMRSDDEPWKVKVFDIYEVDDYHFDGEPYKVIKRFDHIDKIVNTIEGEDSDSNNEYLAKCKCDDCQKSISTRRFSYLLENLNTHEKIQVGKVCMKKYFPAIIKNFYDEVLNHAYYGNEPKYYDVESMLNICVSRFIDSKYNYSAYKKNFETKSIKSEDENFLNSVQDFIVKIKKYFELTKENSEWVRNLKAILDKGYFSQHHFNIFISIVCSYKNFDKVFNRVEYTKKLEEGIHTVTVKKMIKYAATDGMYGIYYKTHFITSNDEYIVVNTKNTDFFNNGTGTEVNIEVNHTSEFNGITYNFAKFSKAKANQIKTAKNLDEMLATL